MNDFDFFKDLAAAYLKRLEESQERWERMREAVEKLPPGSTITFKIVS